MRVPQVSDRIKEVPAQALRGVFAGIGQLLLITDKLRNKAPADVARARTPERSRPAAGATVSEPAVPQEKAAKPAPATPEPAQAAGAKPSSVKSTPAKPATAKATTAKATTAKPAAAKATAATETTAKAAAAKPSRAPSTRDFDKTGNVRLLDDAETSAARVSPAPAAAAPAAAAPAAAKPAAATPAAAVPDAAATADAVGSKPGDSGPPLPNYDELSVASLRARLRNLDLAQVRQLAEYERAHAARADVIGMFERRIAKLEADG
jgi:hypothetical protein